MNLGWIEAAKLPPQKGEQTEELWNWLSSKSKSKYLQFVKDAHYTAKWDENIKKKTAAEIIDRLNQKKDIDLMMSYSTWAGQDLANNKHHTPTMVMVTSNPLSAGIIKSVEDSGYDHIHARVDPFRTEREVRTFHDIIGFKKLGVPYEDSLTGRSYASIDKVEKVAKERGFEIVHCHTLSDGVTQKVAGESMRKCFLELGKKADAIYITSQGGIYSKNIPKLVEIANSHRIPTYSDMGSSHVKLGFLLSVSMADYKYVGQFYAETFAKILNGAKPRELNQIFEDPPRIAINLKTAEIIGYDPPIGVLEMADEIYESIAKPE